MKAILPSLRERKRYITFEVIAQKNVNQEDIIDEITKKTTELYGSLGLSKIGLKIMKDQFNENTGIVRVNRNCVNQIKAAFCSINKIKNEPIIISSKKVSGTLKKARKNT